MTSKKIVTTWRAKPVELEVLYARRAPHIAKAVARGDPANIFAEKVNSNPAHAICSFIEHFEFVRHKARLKTKPKPYELEYLAEKLKEYWDEAAMSLDEAFDMMGRGRGKKTPKERYKADALYWRVLDVYYKHLESFQVGHQQRQTRGQDSPSQRALVATAKALRLHSFETVKSILHRNRVWLKPLNST